MELAANILNTLKHIGDAKFSNNVYNQLIDYTFNSFIIDKNSNLKINFDLKNFKLNTLTSDATVSEADLKDALACLYTLITEFNKFDYDSSSVNVYLEDIGFTEEKIKKFIDIYNEKKSLIRIFLQSISFSYPHVVDVNWKLDYALKENNIERINEPFYLIDFLVEKPGENDLSRIQFSCTVEKLQDLVYKLRQASKTLEKLGQIKDTS